MLLIALLTIYRAILIRLEGNLGLFATIGTHCIMHLSWASFEATASSSFHVIHVSSRTLRKWCGEDINQL